MIRKMAENGMNISDIARELNMDRKTVKKYMNSRAVPRYKERKNGRALKIDPYRDYIRGRIEKYNLSAVRIFDEIRKKGYTGGYSTLKAYCHTLREDRAVKAVIRFETDPGKQAQVDFGEFGRISVDGMNRKLYVFSYILGYSRYRYAEFTVDISTQSVIKMHMNAFNYTGGLPSDILYDNMKQVVTERKLKASESTFNQQFMQFSTYYGFNVRLCYPYRPQTKGKVERNIGYIRGNFFNGREFTSIQDINAQCLSWLVMANSRPNATTGRVPSDALGDEVLIPVNSVPEFKFNIAGTRKVSRECYVHYNSNRYSVPWKYAGRNCTTTEENGILKIHVDGETIEHEIIPGSGRISRKKEHFEGLLKATRELDSIFIGLIDRCVENTKREKLSSAFIINELKEKISKDDIAEKLSGDIYKENSDIVRFLLSKVEEKRRTRESYIDLWKRDGNKMNFTIEHILPEGENLPDSWIDMIAQGNGSKAKELQKEYTHKLGNLTLSAYNSNLSNQSFIYKRDKTDKHGDYIGYKNGLFLNEDLKSIDSWGVDQIEKRGERLKSEILSFLGMDNDKENL